MLQLSDFRQPVDSPPGLDKQNDDYEQYRGVIPSNPQQFAGLLSSYRQPQPDVKVAERRFLILQGQYATLGSSTQLIERLAEEPALYTLLKEAPDQVRKAFGQAIILQLQAQLSDEGSVLKVTIQLPARFENAETALDKFDDSWWLDNCHRSAGSLVFDYAFRDAF